MSLRYEPASEPLHISKQLFLVGELYRAVQVPGRRGATMAVPLAKRWLYGGVEA